MRPLRFRDIYAQAERPVISFELFPPRTPAGEKTLADALPLLRALRPDFMTCTYGAGGSTRDKTLEIVSRLRELEVEAACHLTCVGSSRDELRILIRRIQDAGIFNIVALRGDPPRGESEFRPAKDGLAHAGELVELIRAEPGGDAMGVAVAGYPETHTEAESPALDLAHLKRKVDAGADVVITQLFFDNADFHRFCQRAVAAGIDAPIVPGLMPIQSSGQIRRITAMCGATIPADLDARLSAAGDDAQLVREIGVEHCIEQTRELCAAGVPGVHFYVLNTARTMTRILGETGLA